MSSTAETILRYTADTRVSQFTIQAFAAGIVAVVAHSPKIAIREWSADIRFTPESFANASVVVKGQIASFDLLDEVRDDDRRLLQRVMMQEVLEVAKYPDFVFESTTVGVEKQRTDLYRMNIAGNLKLHGQTRRQTLLSQVAVGSDSFRAYGEFTVRQTDFDIKIASIAGGSLKLQNELKCAFYIVARRSEE